MENLGGVEHFSKQSFYIDTSRLDGLLIQVHHTVFDARKRKKCLRFVTVTFSIDHEQIAAFDQPGNIFIIDLPSLKYWMLPSTGYVSVIAYSSYRKNEVLVGKGNGVVEILNADTGVISDRLVGHKFPVQWISFCEGFPLCITGSSDEAYIWCLETNSQIQELSLRTNLKIKLVRFTPVQNSILIAFEDDTLQIWKFGNQSSAMVFSSERWKNHKINSIAFTRNGQCMVAGGNTSNLFLMTLSDYAINSIKCLPESVVSVKHLQFLSHLYDGGANKFLVVLTNDNTIFIVNIDANCIVQKIRFPNICINTGELNIYLAEKLFSSVPQEIKKETSDKKVFPKHKSKYHKNCLEKYQVPSESTEESNKVLSNRYFINLFKRDHLQKQMNEMLNKEKIKPLLKEFGEYPVKFRPIIWKNVLQLPINKAAFQALSDKGPHVKTEFFLDKYPFENKYLLNILKRVISCLCHWSPLFSQVQYLPSLVIPFVKLFKNDALAGFEAVATLLVNWCQRWFEFFPYPPVNVLAIIENLLCEWDEELLCWFNDHHVPAQTYAWPLLEYLFVKNLSTEEWLRLFDHVLSNEPWFLIFGVVSFNISCRNALLGLTEVKDFEAFYHSRTTINVKRLISKMYEMNSKTKEDNHPNKYLKPFKPLAHGEMYEIFNEYPKTFVDIQAQQINTIKQEQLDLLTEQARLAEARLEQDRVYENSIKRRMQNIQLRDLEERYKEAVNEEEMRLAAHRLKVTKMKREFRNRKKRIINEAREEAMRTNVEKKKAELEASLKDIDRKRTHQKMLMKEAEEELADQYNSLADQKKELKFQLDMAEKCNTFPAPEHKILQEQQNKLTEEIVKLTEDTLYDRKSFKKCTSKLAAAERLLQSVETQLAEEMAVRQNALLAGQDNIKVMQLETDTQNLERDVEHLSNKVFKQRMNESKQKERLTKDSMADRKALYEQQLWMLQGLADLKNICHNYHAVSSTNHSTGSSSSVSTQTSSSDTSRENSDFKINNLVPPSQPSKAVPTGKSSTILSSFEPSAKVSWDEVLKSSKLPSKILSNSSVHLSKPKSAH